ncbi:DUF952 domain-containing protein [Deinococcus alpinitundrae]|uniref:DUF952 domain-containing protein n=1 Tax=Deinococcus alpinitundrae TaxID=468913 RepID=UPI00137A6417|nr:DUF952 domain-containing protein [Deinococcus alpinitundrae]
MIVHITDADAWQEAQRHGQYVHASLGTQGFIHCSTPTEQQLIEVANTLFQGQSDLVLLLVDPAQLTSELKYEEYEDSGLFFPHIYGPINTDAVSRVVPFPSQSDGTFRLPDIVVEEADN